MPVLQADPVEAAILGCTQIYYTLFYTDAEVHGETSRFYIMPINARIGMCGTA